MFEENDYMDMQAPTANIRKSSSVSTRSTDHHMDNWKDRTTTTHQRGPHLAPPKFVDEDEDDYTDMQTTPVHSLRSTPVHSMRTTPVHSLSTPHNPNISRSVGNSPLLRTNSNFQTLESRLKMGGYAKNDDDDYDNLPVPNSDDVYTTMTSPLHTPNAAPEDTYTVMVGTPKSSPAPARKTSLVNNSVYAEMTGTPPPKTKRDHPRVTSLSPKHQVARRPLKSAPTKAPADFGASESFRDRSSALSISRDLVDDVKLKRSKTVKGNRAAMAVQKYLELSEMERSMKEMKINKQQKQQQSKTMRNMYTSTRPTTGGATSRSQHSLDRKYVEWLAKNNANAGGKNNTKKKSKQVEVIDITQDFKDENKLFVDAPRTKPGKSPKSRKMSFFNRSAGTVAARKPRSKTALQLGNGNNNNTDQVVQNFRTPPSSPPTPSNNTTGGRKSNRFATLANSFRFMARSDSKLNRYMNGGRNDFSQSEGDASAFLYATSEDGTPVHIPEHLNKKGSLRMSKTMSLERIFGSGTRRRRPPLSIDVCDSIEEQDPPPRKPSHGDSDEFFNQYDVIRGFGQRIRTAQRRSGVGGGGESKLANRFGSVKRGSTRQRKRVDSSGRGSRGSNRQQQKAMLSPDDQQLPLGSPTSGYAKTSPFHETSILESLREEEIPEVETTDGGFECEVMELNINKSEMSFVNAAKILFNRLHDNEPCTIDHPETSPSCVCKRPIPGKTLVNWLQQCIKLLYEDGTCGHQMTRTTVLGMLQVLVEKGYLKSVTSPNEEFRDDIRSYVFGDEVWQDYVSTSSTMTSSNVVVTSCEHSVCDTSKKLEEIEALEQLRKESGDALFRVVLRKPPKDRTLEDLQRIYEEVVDLKALTDLNDTIKRELARVAQIELFDEVDEIVFRQGDAGYCWYVVLKGTFDVLVDGKSVCTYGEGEEFGRLALVNDTTRAATVVSREADGQLIRIDKEDFARILKDAEANTISLKESNETVLIFQKTSSVPTPPDSSSDGSSDMVNGDKGYTISLGKPEKILEYIVRNTPVWIPTDQDIEDFILTYPTFMTTKELCKALLSLYRKQDDDEVFETCMKRKVVYFVVRWSHIHTNYFCQDMMDSCFLQELEDAISVDIENDERYKQLAADIKQLWIECKTTTEMNRIETTEDKSLTKFDHLPLEIHMSETASMIIKTPLIYTVPEVIQLAAKKLHINQTDGLVFYEWKEDGDLTALPDNMTSIATALGINSRLYLGQDSADDHHSSAHASFVRCNDVQEQDLLDFIDMSSNEIAYAITEFDVNLLNKTHPLEYVYKIFGAHKYKQTTSNHNLLSRRFDQLAYWVPSVICCCDNVNLRATLLRKFIKIALLLKKHQNLNAFLALTIGMCNHSVVRMRNTWSKVPVKYRNIVQDAEKLLDPSRNHRAYRNHEASLEGVRVPYFPLMMKDLTFQHEGNASWKNDMLDFEKMHKLADNIVKVTQVRLQDLGLELTDFKDEEAREISNDKTRRRRQLASKLKIRVITDQKLLNRKSNQLEPAANRTT